MALPTDNDEYTLNIIYLGAPFVQVATKSTIDLNTLDWDYLGEPFWGLSPAPPLTIDRIYFDDNTHRVIMGVRKGANPNCILFNDLTCLTDDFESYSVGTIDKQGYWSVVLNTIEIVNNSGNEVFKSNTSLSVCVAMNSTVMPNDQFAEVTINKVGTLTTYAIGVALRLTGSGTTLNGVGFYSTSDTQRLWHIDNGVKTNYDPPTYQTLHVGDVIRLEAQGNTARCYINNILLTGVATNGTADISSYPSGKAGISAYNTSDEYGDNWHAGDLSCP